MTTIPPTPPPSPALSVPQAVVTAVPVAELPAQIATLPPNTVIDATVLAQAQAAAQATVQVQAATQAAAQAAARGVVQLATPFGPIAVRLPIPLPANALLRLLVQGTGTALQLRVIAINGQALAGGSLASPAGETDGLTLASGALSGPLGGARGPADGLAPAPTPASGPAASAAAAGAAETMPAANPSGGLPATVIVASGAGLANGTQLIVRLLSVVPPDGTPAPLPEPGAATSAAPNPLAVAADVASKDPAPGGPALPDEAPPGSAPATLVEAGTGATPDAPTQSAGPPNLPGPAAAAVPAAPTSASAGSLPASLAGVVAPNSLAGQPLVQTAIGLISLGGGATLAPGSRVTLQPLGPPTPPPADVAGQPSPAPSSWASVGDAIATLQKADPAAAQLVMQRLPDLGPQFAVNLVVMVAAAQTGDMRAWLGDRAVKALEKAGRADLVARLEGDAAENRVPVTLPQSDGRWQVLTLPLFFGERLERVRITMRRPKDERDQDEGRDEEGLRFLVDVDMSRLGAMQFDGLVKRQAKQFDLIVRSRRELAEPLRRDINGIFVRALEGLGMTGGVAFKQAVAFIEPLPLHTDHAGLTA